MPRARAHPVVLLLLLCAALPAAAHRAPGSLSTIEFNAHTGMLEIVHRLHLHDAELGVASVLRDPGLSMSKLESRARVALYVEERFRIMIGEAELGLRIVGAEISGDYLMVYQERNGPLPAVVRIRDDILRDAFQGQINQVNITDGDVVRTLTFSANDEWHSFEFRSPEDPAKSAGD